MQKYLVTVLDDRTEWTNEAGNLHRLDGPAIEFNDGDRAWYQNNRLHRLDGPAIEGKNGDKFWYQDNQRHRLDGPAIEYASGEKQYWIKGVSYTEQEFLAKTQLRGPFSGLTQRELELTGTCEPDWY